MQVEFGPADSPRDSTDLHKKTRRRLLGAGLEISD